MPNYLDNNLLAAFSGHKFAGLTFDGNSLPELNRANAVLCERLILQDKKYNSPKPKAYFDKAKMSAGSVSKIPQSVWKDIVIEIARVNRTRTPDATKNGIASLLTDPKYHERLLNGDPVLIEDLFAQLKKNGLRGDISLLSKVCKWVYYWEVFPQGGFSIYDSVVRSVLPYYAKVHGVTIKGKLDKYINYHHAIVDICKKTGLTPHEFDRIAWYFYRDNPVHAALAVLLA